MDTDKYEIIDDYFISEYLICNEKIYLTRNGW